MNRAKSKNLEPIKQSAVKMQSDIKSGTGGKENLGKEMVWFMQRMNNGPILIS